MRVPFSWVEARIRAARHAGELDGLPGAGEPLPPDATDGLPGAERFEVLLARSVGAVPEEVDLMRELAELRRRIEHPQPGDDVGALRRAVSRRALRLSMLHEANGRNLSARRAFGDGDPG